MRIERLTSRPNGTVAAAMLTEAGDEVEVIFTIAKRGGIAVASPDQAILENETLDAESVRAVIAAVLAFDRVAVHSSGEDG